jgi:uncharacterized SAM-binding protein YcdF (DUF218 family)
MQQFSTWWWLLVAAIAALFAFWTLFFPNSWVARFAQWVIYPLAWFVTWIRRWTSRWIRPGHTTMHSFILAPLFIVFSALDHGTFMFVDRLESRAVVVEASADAAPFVLEEKLAISPTTAFMVDDAAKQALAEAVVLADVTAAKVVAVPVASFLEDALHVRPETQANFVATGCLSLDAASTLPFQGVGHDAGFQGIVAYAFSNPGSFRGAIIGASTAFANFLARFATGFPTSSLESLDEIDFSSFHGVASGTSFGSIVANVFDTQGLRDDAASTTATGSDFPVLNAGQGLEVSFQAAGVQTFDEANASLFTSIRNDAKFQVLAGTFSGVGFLTCGFTAARDRFLESPDFLDALKEKRAFHSDELQFDTKDARVDLRYAAFASATCRFSEGEGFYRERFAKNRGARFLTDASESFGASRVTDERFDDRLALGFDSRS